MNRRIYFNLCLKGIVIINLLACCLINAMDKMNHHEDLLTTRKNSIIAEIYKSDGYLLKVDPSSIENIPQEIVKQYQQLLAARMQAQIKAISSFSEDQLDELCQFLKGPALESEFTQYYSEITQKLFLASLRLECQKDAITKITKDDLRKSFDFLPEMFQRLYSLPHLSNITTQLLRKQGENVHAANCERVTEELKKFENENVTYVASFIFEVMVNDIFQKFSFSSEDQFKKKMIANNSSKHLNLTVQNKKKSVEDS